MSWWAPCSWSSTAHRLICSIGPAPTKPRRSGSPELIWNPRILRNSMQFFSFTADAVAATTKKTEKVRLVADYFLSRPVEEAAQADVFFSGRAFPAWEERTLQVGGAQLWRAVSEISGKSESHLSADYRRHGDVSSSAQVLLEHAAARRPSLTVPDVAAAFDELARTHTAAQKGRQLQEILRRATAAEAKYIIKIIGGDLRIGLRESLVEEAIA